MEGYANSRPRSSSGPGSNLNNMICNFSKNSVTTKAKNIGPNSSRTDRSIYMNKTQSDNVPPVENMSKSMGTSFIMSLRGRVSYESIPDPLIIRHAGYLLKRSNFPYAMTSNSKIVATNGALTEIGYETSIVEPPLIENVIRDFPLPELDQFSGGLNEPIEGGVNEIFDHINIEEALCIDPEASEKEPTKVSKEETCFCSPVVQFFETLLRKRKTPNALVSQHDNNVTLGHITTLKPKLPSTSTKTKSLHIASSTGSPSSHINSQSTIINYSMPLKAPARSTPVPISPQLSRPSIQRIGSSSQLPLKHSLVRTYSNGSKLNIAAMADNIGSGVEMQKKEKKIYPPPPADCIDPKDGHIWRAKYCILEDGILYFYRTADEGESDEAQEERNESKYQSLDAMEGTGFDYETTSYSPKRSMASERSNKKLANSGLSGKAILRESMQSSQDLRDLSKSPMPYKKSDIFEYANKRSESSLCETQSSTPLRHSHSTNTFNFDSDILWEKRVALDCVGAVRSSEQNHGEHAFELLAFGMDGHRDEMSDSLSEKSQNEITDRLILRAGTSDDMNNWMFQFHRSLAFYMQRIVQQHNNHRPDSPLLHRRLPTPLHGGKGLSLSPFGTRHSSSPRSNSISGSLKTSNIPGSLSHGHGRNALYRRQVRDSKDSTLLISPVSTPGGGSSPVDSAKLLVPSVSILSTENVAPKYVPPHLRNKQAPQKYIPPHLRRKVEGADSTDSDVLDVADSQPQIYEELITDKERDASDQGDDSYSDSATSSLLSKQMDDSDSVSIVINMRLGGCADPTVVVGSILDHHYISRKASIVGNARLEAYGGRGGGYFEEKRSKCGRSVLKWEVGAASECGVRNSNEDSYVAINNLDELIRSQGLVSFADQDFGETKQQGLYAIFDGHVGNQAARFGAEKFPDILIEEQSSLASRDSASMTSIETRTDSILRSAFDRLDRDFCNLCTKDGRDWDCGSTALVALIVDDVVTLANLGDCRGVVCRMLSSDMADLDEWEHLDADIESDEKWGRSSGGRTEKLRDRLYWKEITEIHSPLLIDERNRIEEANGWIINETEIPTGQLHRMDFFDKDVIEIVKRCFADRLKQHRSDPVRQIQIARTCGDLAVSRAIGDRDFKAAYNMSHQSRNTSHPASMEERSGLSVSWEGPPVFIYPEGHSGRFKGDLVSHEPDIKFFKVGQKGVVDEFLLMACDGLWDVMDGDDAVRIAKNLLFDKKLSAKDGAARLAELAKHLGSSDNITVVLIRFYWEHEEDI